MLFEHDRLALAARWGALAASLLLAAGQAGGRGPAVVPAAVVLLVLALVQTVWPGVAVRWPVVALSLVAPAVAVAATGGIASPFLPTLLPPVFAARASGGPARDQSQERANELLTELHRVATVLPASLDLATVVRTATDQVEQLLHAESVSLSLDVDTPPSEDRADIVPLRANGQTVGYLSIKRAMPLFPEERVALDTLAGQLALAVDNARWFGRVRSMAAQEERARLARELHDRLGQDLAAVGFELDSLAGAPAGVVHERLPVVADSVRSLARALRNTLADLRTDVDEARDLASGLASFLARVEGRSGLQTSLRLHREAGRLPVPVERELLRVAQEAVVNVERHAHATAVTVTLLRTPDWTLLEVADDGIGLTVAPETAVARGRYGILGMRERAESVGGRLTVSSKPGCGTVVSCAVPVSAPSSESGSGSTKAAA